MAKKKFKIGEQVIQLRSDYYCQDCCCGDCEAWRENPDHVGVIMGEMNYWNNYPVQMGNSRTYINVDDLDYAIPKDAVVYRVTSRKEPATRWIEADKFEKTTLKQIAKPFVKAIAAKFKGDKSLFTVGEFTFRQVGTGPEAVQYDT